MLLGGSYDQVMVAAVPGEIVELVMLRQLIESIGTDVYGRHEKLIIFTSSLVVALLRTLVLLSSLASLPYANEFHSTLESTTRLKGPFGITPLLPLKIESNQYVDSFIESDENRFLVATKRILRTSRIFNRAFQSISIDPDCDEHWDIQCDSRVQRLSQKYCTRRLSAHIIPFYI